MKLSIITINLNNYHGLRKTIDSVITQSWQQFEWIIIDGGSTDGSKELIESTVAGSPCITFWCSEQDNGIYNAMNKGIQHATGDYCLFLNSGDCLYDRFVLEHLCPDLNGYDFVCANAWFVDCNGSYMGEKKTPSHFHPGCLLYQHFPHQSVFIRTVLLRNRPYREDMHISSDWEQMFHELTLNGASYHHSSLVLSCMEVGGISDQFFDEMYRETEFIISTYFDPLQRNRMCLEAFIVEFPQDASDLIALDAYLAFVHSTYTQQEFYTLYTPFRRNLSQGGSFHHRLINAMCLAGHMSLAKFLYRILSYIRRG